MFAMVDDKSRPAYSSSEKAHLWMAISEIQGSGPTASLFLAEGAAFPSINNAQGPFVCVWFASSLIRRRKGEKERGKGDLALSSTKHQYPLSEN